MTIQQLQDWVAASWASNTKHQPSVETQILYIVEELGEVAEAIRKQNGHKDRKDMQADLGSEIADLVIAIVTLSNHFDVNISSEIQAFQKRLAARETVK